VVVVVVLVVMFQGPPWAALSCRPRAEKPKAASKPLGLETASGGL
jgi:hypothetical protein